MLVVVNLCFAVNVREVWEAERPVTTDQFENVREYLEPLVEGLETTLQHLEGVAAALHVHTAVTPITGSWYETFDKQNAHERAFLKVDKSKAYAPGSPQWKAQLRGLAASIDKTSARVERDVQAARSERQGNVTSEQAGEVQE